MPEDNLTNATTGGAREPTQLQKAAAGRVAKQLAETVMASKRINDVLVPSSAVRKKLGGISDMTLWRRMKNDPFFPRPKVMSGRRYWWESSIDEYIEGQPEG